MMYICNGFLFPGSPPNIKFNVVQDTFLNVEGIVAVHNLRIWGLTTDKTALSAHLAICEYKIINFVTKGFEKS